jgi:soluble lytic murein transglycosylase
MAVRSLVALWVALAGSGAGSGACSGDDGASRRATLPGEAAPATAAATAPAAPAPQPIAPTFAGSPVTGPVGELSEQMAMPYFPPGPTPLGKAAAAFAAGDYKTARPLLAAAAKTRRGAADAAHLAALIAVADAALGNWPAAASGFEKARAAIPLLADYLGYREAVALYFARRPTDALRRARAVSAESIVGADAELLVGDVLRGQAGPDAARATADHYRGYLARRKSPIRYDEARFRLAEALEQLRGPADQKEALALYRALTVEAPLSRWAVKAEERLAAIAAQLPAAERAALTDRTSAEQIRRGMELFDAMRNPESEAAFAAAVATPGITAGERCVAAYHRAQSRFKARDRVGAAPMFDEAAALCKQAGDADKEIKSYYQAGRSYAFIDKHDLAVARYQAAQAIDPRHSYSDDALLREAEEWDSLKKDDEVTRVLSSLPAKFPTGDMRAEAMWRLGWRAWRSKKLKDAIGWWQKQIEVMPIDDNYWAEGQAQYWIGRAQLAQGNRARALASWESAIRSYPAAYYAMMALNRIREIAPERFTKLVAELAADPAGFDAKAPAFTFKPRTEWATPGFARAMELLRLGLGEPARAELRLLGLTAPAGKTRVDDPDLVEKLWAMAYLYDRSGDYENAHWPTRWHILDYRRSWPTGANRARWRISYPRAYWPLLTDHAARNNVPVAMQIAIVREESAFNPQLESYANAVGLTQMINSTATRFARGTGIDPTRENLRDAEKNVTIGSRFLGFLFTEWNRFTLLVPPSYNAGETGVRRMLKARGTWDSDEFIEGIVDDQARNYSKRVLGTFFTYSWLYEQTVPEIPNRIPPELLPKP